MIFTYKKDTPLPVRCLLFYSIPFLCTAVRYSMRDRPFFQNLSVFQKRRYRFAAYIFLFSDAASAF